MELSLAKRPLSRNPLMLKDYLLDDLSSCSSSGFRSYPRRQCCTTVRFLLQIDLKTKPPKYKKTQLLKSPLKPASTTSISAFQRASEAVINAVKHLPFVSFKSSPFSSKFKLGILPRSLSRKFLKRSFWKKNDHKEIQKWKPINHLAEEKCSSPSDSIIKSGAGAGTGEYSTSSTSDSNSKSSNSWSDSDFTTSDESLQSLSTANSNSNSNSGSKIGEGVVIENNKKRLPEDEVVSSKRVGLIVGGADDSMDLTTGSNSSTYSNYPNTEKKHWPNEEKEQFSPLSVLDCPFEDDDDEVSSSSPFQQRLARVEGTKKRLMKKIMRFESLTQLEPVNLVKRIALSESDQESNESPLHHSSESIDQYDFVSDIEEVTEEEDSQAEEEAFKLLEHIKYTMPSSTNIKPELENLLLDFFKLGLDNSSENATGIMSKSHVSVTSDEELLHTAKDWLNGNPIEQLMEWEVKKYREVYIRDMERGGEWRKLDKEKQEVALEIEVEVFDSIMNELLVDFLLS